MNGLRELDYNHGHFWFFKNLSNDLESITFGGTHILAGIKNESMFNVQNMARLKYIFEILQWLTLGNIHAKYMIVKIILFQLTSYQPFKIFTRYSMYQCNVGSKLN